MISKKFIYNLSYSFIAQISAIMVSLLFSIGVTKIFDINEYGFWQLFILYSNYIGFLHFGICDGLYLKLGGRKLSSLNKINTSNQFLYFCLIQLGISVIFFLITYFYFTGIKQALLERISVFIILTNVQTYLSYILLSTNNIREYSFSVLIEKLLIIGGVVCAYFFTNFSYLDLIHLYLLSRFISIVYLVFILRSSIFVNTNFKIANLYIFKVYAINGVFLLFSNIFSSLIIGNTRFFVEDRFGIVVFSKLSFSVSLVFFFVVFISQIGLLIFPILRNLNKEKLANIFETFGSFLSIFFIVSMLGFYPLKWIIINYLPQFLDSIKALIIILPICLFEGKVQILFNTYYKVLRKQRVLFVINLISFGSSLIFSIIGVYLFTNIEIVLYFMVISVYIRYILSEVFLLKLLKIQYSHDYYFPLLFSVLFILINKIEPNSSMILYLILVVMFIWYQYKSGKFNLIFDKIKR